MKFKKNTICLISTILIGLVLNSCSIYTRHLVQKDVPPNFKGRVLHLLWYNHDKSTMYMTQATLSDSTLTGLVQEYKKNEPYAKKRELVNVYINTFYPSPTNLPANYSIPISKINKIEVFDYDPLLGVVKTLFVIAGVGVAAIALLAVIIALTKESCPFIYSYNGKGYDFTGEIYSGAIFPSLERNDYLPLPNLKPFENKYQLLIANKVKEIQYTNLAELLVIDHPKDTDVLVDKYGKYQTISKTLQKPITASATHETNILPLVAAKDSLKYMGDAIADSTQSHDTVFLTFNRPENTNTAKLVLRAKNSFWLDHTLGEFFDLFGNKYDSWYQKQVKAKKDTQPNWSLEQGIPLSVYMMKNGEWQFIDYFNVVGPMADRDLVMPIDISSLNSDKINLKLECGSLFWEIDYAGIDFSPQQKVYQQIVSLNEALDQAGNDVKALMNKDDKEYYVMPQVGNQAVLKYEVPKLQEGYDRTVFLHSKGHYEVLREAKGRMNVAYVKSFREPGKLGQFSRERFLDLKKSMNN